MKRTLTLAVIAALALSHETSLRFRGRVDVPKIREELFRRVDPILPHHKEQFDDEDLFNMIAVKAQMSRLVRESQARTMELGDDEFHSKNSKKDGKDTKDESESESVDRSLLKKLQDKFTRSFDDMDDDELLTLIALKDFVAREVKSGQYTTTRLAEPPKTEEKDEPKARKGYIDFDDEYFVAKPSKEANRGNKTSEESGHKQKKKEFIAFNDVDSELLSLHGLKDLLTESKKGKLQVAGIRG